MTESPANSNQPLKDLVSVVTGASSGIGRAIAISLARSGAAVCGVGRDQTTLCQTIAEAKRFSAALPFQADLVADENISRLLQVVRAEFGRLDILVHSAGVIYHGPMREACIKDLDSQYVTNIRMPYLLTQTMLPMLREARGQIVFINSSVGVSAKRPEAGQFSATQHAMKAVADSLREEVNPEGIRVLTVYPGRTATPRQERLHQHEGRAYRPEALLQAEDIASIVVHSLALPKTAEVTDIHIRPMMKLAPQ
jgi:NADP-dependent 3-hydroxy acid dehydrogenase YdfG